MKKPKNRKCLPTKLTQGQSEEALLDPTIKTPISGQNSTKFNHLSHVVQSHPHPTPHGSKFMNHQLKTSDSDQNLTSASPSTNRRKKHLSVGPHTKTTIKPNHTKNSSSRTYKSGMDMETNDPTSASMDPSITNELSKNQLLNSTSNRSSSLPMTNHRKPITTPRNLSLTNKHKQQSKKKQKKSIIKKSQMRRQLNPRGKSTSPFRKFKQGLGVDKDLTNEIQDSETEDLEVGSSSPVPVKTKRPQIPFIERMKLIPRYHLNKSKSEVIMHVMASKRVARREYYGNLIQERYHEYLWKLAKWKKRKSTKESIQSQSFQELQRKFTGKISFKDEDRMNNERPSEELSNQRRRIKSKESSINLKPRYNQSMMKLSTHPSSSGGSSKRIVRDIQNIFSTKSIAERMIDQLTPLTDRHSEQYDPVIISPDIMSPDAIAYAAKAGRRNADTKLSQILKITNSDNIMKNTLDDPKKRDSLINFQEIYDKQRSLRLAKIKGQLAAKKDKAKGQQISTKSINPSEISILPLRTIVPSQISTKETSEMMIPPIIATRKTSVVSNTKADISPSTEKINESQSSTVGEITTNQISNVSKITPSKISIIPDKINRKIPILVDPDPTEKKISVMSIKPVNKISHPSSHNTASKTSTIPKSSHLQIHQSQMSFADFKTSYAANITASRKPLDE